MAKYQIKLKNTALLDRWRSLEESIPSQMQRCKIFLEENHHNRLRSGGKLKKLKGRLQGILQYDLTDNHRVHYRVDTVAKIVYIEYIGAHP